MERWAEHFQELHSRENIVMDTVIESTANLPVMQEFDDPPSVIKLQERMAFHQKSSRLERPLFSTTCTRSFYSAGKKELYPRR